VTFDSGRVFDAREQRFGRYYDEFEIGDIFRHWPGKTITDCDNHLFCELTLAVSPLHNDSHFAAIEMPGGQNIVVGTLVYAVLLGMSVPDVSGKAIAALGTDKLRHVLPVHAGDTLYAESEVISLRESRSRPGTGVVKVKTEGANQRGEIVCEFERSVLLPSRAYDASGHGSRLTPGAARNTMPPGYTNDCSRGDAPGG
jgi:acyl dehydratase